MTLFLEKYTHSECLVSLEGVYYLILDMALDHWRLQMHCEINTGLKTGSQCFCMLTVPSTQYLEQPALFSLSSAFYVCLF